MWLWIGVAVPRSNAGKPTPPAPTQSKAILDRFPEQVDTEQLIAESYLKAKLDRAEAALARDEVLSQAEVVERSQK